MDEDIWIQSYQKFFFFSFSLLWNQIEAKKVNGKDLKTYLDEITAKEVNDFRKEIEVCSRLADCVNRDVMKTLNLLENKKKDKAMENK